MFSINKYHTWYFSIINKAKLRKLEGYSEKHHIIPASFGGNNSLENIVKLTAREHFICHLLLVRITSGVNQKKMIRAANAMIYYRSKNRTISIELKTNSKIYKTLKEQYSNMMKGPRSEETKLKMSISAKARIRSPLSEDHKKAISVGRSGKLHSEETKDKISKASIEKYKSTLAREILSEAVKTKMSSPETREKFLKGIRQRTENYKSKKLSFNLNT